MMTNLFESILNMSLSSVWLIIAVVCARLLLLRAPKWTRMLLWALVAVRLVLPFTPESPLSLVPEKASVTLVTEVTEPEHMEMISPEGQGTPLTPDKEPTPDIPENGPITTPITPTEPVMDVKPSEQAPIVDIVPETVYADPAKTEDKAINIGAVLSIVWISGMAVMIGYFAVTYIAMRSRLKDAVHGEGRVWYSDRIGEPFVFGIIHPRIYMPFSVSEKDAPHVLAHENSHIKRGDHIVKPIVFLILCVHWFNPAVWLAYLLFSRDMELACDEAVIRGMDEDKVNEYSHALVTLSTKNSFISLHPISFGGANMKNRLKNILNYKKPTLWIIIVALILCIAVAVCFFTSPEKEEGVNATVTLLIDDENNPPATLTLHRIAEGNYVTGYTEADNISVTIQMNSKTAESIYDWLTYFTVGDEITESEGYSPFYFTVKYENGEEVHFGFYDCEIDGKKYAIEFNDGAVGTDGEKNWREVMTNTLNSYTDYSDVTRILRLSTSASYYATAAESYSVSEYTTKVYGGEVFLPLYGPSPDYLPSAIVDNVSFSKLYPRVYLKDTENVNNEAMFLPFEPDLVWCNENDSPNQKIYQVVTFPTLMEKNGKIIAEIPKSLCSLMAEEVAELCDEARQEYLNTPKITDPDYDWSAHVFPQPADNDIVKIEISRDAYGAMATGIDEIDHIRIDIRETWNQHMDNTPENSFKNAKSVLLTLFYGEEVPTDSVESVHYQCKIIATYADGGVIECPIPYAVKDGKKYTIQQKTVPGGDSYVIQYGLEYRIKMKQWEILKEKGYSTEIIDSLMELENAVGTTQTLYNSDDSLSISRPPISEEEYYPTSGYLPDYFTIEISEPKDMQYTEKLVVESEDKTRSFTCYGGTDGIVKYDNNGDVHWYKTPILSANTGNIYENNYADTQIYFFYVWHENNK